MRGIFTWCMFLWVVAAQAQFVVFNDVQQKNVQTTSFDLDWRTNTAGISCIKYGVTSSLELGTIIGTNAVTEHSLNISSLMAASFYYAQVCIIVGTDTINGPTAYYSTASSSSGAIQVYFNKSIDASLAQNGATPDIVNSGSSIENMLIDYIDNAQNTIDLSIYNNNRSNIVTALTNAHQRGVRVRYIAYQGTANTALSSSPAFPVAYVNTAGLMHNKFMVIDAEDANLATVWTGSMNWTTNNIFDDYNNVVVVQDQALARAYVMEFEEMWGSNTATFNSANSKVGPQKTDNTPHNFYIGGRWVECYFSPSDGVTSEIVRHINAAGSNVQFALLTMTNNDLGNAVNNLHQGGDVAVRGIIQNVNDIGSEFTFLQGNGVDVVEDNVPNDLHHKYCFIDANYPSSDPMVITGSHNWSAAAEDENDENTLIIHDADITNMFLQEFGARWCAVNGSANCALTFPNPIDGVNQVENLSNTIVNLYPNPTTHQFTLDIHTTQAASFSYQLYNALGQLMLEQNIGTQNGTLLEQVNVENLNAGQYWVRIIRDDQAVMLPLIINE